jgi:hypothetical protein
MRDEIVERTNEVVRSETLLYGVEELDEGVFVGVVVLRETLLIENVGGDEMYEMSEVLCVGDVEKLALCGYVCETRGDGVK